MSEDRKIVRIRPADATPHPDLTPMFDPTFDVLLELALAGELRVYFAAVPTALIRPFDTQLDVLASPVGRAAVEQVFRNGVEGRHQSVWLYEDASGFVLSDDYIVWAALQRGQPDYVPSWVLGKPRHKDVKDIQGPVNVREALGWT